MFKLLAEFNCTSESLLLLQNKIALNPNVIDKDIHHKIFMYGTCVPLYHMISILFFIGTMKEEFQFAIDRGGTFTDIWARCPGGKIKVMKLLSVDPQNYKDAPREGIRRILEQVKFFMNFESIQS